MPKNVLSVLLKKQNYSLPLHPQISFRLRNCVLLATAQSQLIERFNNLEEEVYCALKNRIHPKGWFVIVFMNKQETKFSSLGWGAGAKKQ